MEQTPPFVLLVDDDRDDLEMLSMELTYFGIATKTFDSSELAIRYLTGSPPEKSLPYMIILDFNMPKLNGGQVLYVLKNDIRTKDIPVVIYSTAMSPPFKKTLMALGAYTCYTKPQHYEEFKAQLLIFNKLSTMLRGLKSVA